MSPRESFTNRDLLRGRDEDPPGNRQLFGALADVSRGGSGSGPGHRAATRLLGLVAASVIAIVALGITARGHASGVAAVARFALAGGPRTGTVRGRSVVVTSHPAGGGRSAELAIVAGPPLGETGGTASIQSGVRYTVTPLRSPSAAVISWTQRGRTRVLAGDGSAPATLLRLAEALNR